MPKVTITLTEAEARDVLHALRIGVEDGSLTDNQPDREAAAHVIIEKIKAALRKHANAR